MTRRQTNKSTYGVTTDRARYAVTLTRLSNTTCGQPRFEANIIILEVFGKTPNTDYYYTPCYRFGGHYLNEQGEARHIVEYYERTLED